jgi:hypothetical protein
MSAGNHGRGGGDRADRQAAHLTRHLNQRHPDTVLFLARHAGGQIEATAAELLAVTEAGVTVATDASIEPVHIAFDEAASARGDVRSRLRRLLEVTRAATPDCPLTSSDRDMRPSPRSGCRVEVRGGCGRRHELDRSPRPLLPHLR